MNLRNLGVFFVVLLMASAMALTGCSRATIYQMDSGERTAGAEGEASVVKDNNGNNIVTLKVAHLPQPSRLEQGMGVYVVWVNPGEGRTAFNMGQIRLSDARTGEITFTTPPYSNFSIVVTAEVDGMATSPSNQVVLRRGVGGR